jgi:hypothetical protein
MTPGKLRNSAYLTPISNRGQPQVSAGWPGAACGEAVLVPTTYFAEGHLEAVARHAPGWLASNAPAVVRACPPRLEPLLEQVYLVHRNDLVMSAGTALAQEAGGDREAIEACLASLLYVEDMEAFRRALSG